MQNTAYLKLHPVVLPKLIRLQKSFNAVENESISNQMKHRFAPLGRHSCCYRSFQNSISNTNIFVINVFTSGAHRHRSGGRLPRKVSGMFVVSLRGKNCRFWSHLGLGQTTNLLVELNSSNLLILK